MEHESKIPGGNRKHTFWQTSINDQRPKLRVYINCFVIVGLIDMGEHTSIFIPESWHSNILLQEAGVQFLGIGTLSQVKQRTSWVKFIGLEGQRGRLRLYVANIIVNLWDCDLLHQ